jgi:hypothetical protein
MTQQVFYQILRPTVVAVESREQRFEMSFEQAPGRRRNKKLLVRKTRQTGRVKEHLISFIDVEFSGCSIGHIQLYQAHTAVGVPKWQSSSNV